MSTTLFDSDEFLLENEHWTKLDIEWGTPVDLETDTDVCQTPVNQRTFSTLDLRRPTFDSKIVPKRKQRRHDTYTLKSPLSTVDYKEFLLELNQENVDLGEQEEKQFYFIGGEIFSATSVDEICSNIDSVFNSIEKLCATTSTMRVKKQVKPATRIPEVIECSISMSDLSFDDTKADSSKEKSDGDDVDRFIDELFNELDRTVASLQKSREMSSVRPDKLLDQSSLESVTTLVRKFSSVLKSPIIKSSPRRQRRCCEKFKDLAQFWQSRVLFENGN